MTEHIIFKNPPITEAILSVDLQGSQDVDLKGLDALHPHIKERFPKREDRNQMTAQIELKEGQATTTNTATRHVGYLYRSLNDNKAVLVTTNGYFFHKLKPYESWELFRTEARELWNLYYKIVVPARITRVSLRYLNRIELPLPFGDFKDYIMTAPEIAPNLPQSLSSFFMKLVVPQVDGKSVAVISETIDAPTTDGKLPFIFDISVSCEVSFSDNAPEIWSEFEKLRAFKNDIFLNSLTDKAKELFQ